MSLVVTEIDAFFSEIIEGKKKIARKYYGFCGGGTKYVIANKQI